MDRVLDMQVVAGLKSGRYSLANESEPSCISRDEHRVETYFEQLPMPFVYHIAPFLPCQILVVIEPHAFILVQPGIGVFVTQSLLIINSLRGAPNLDLFEHQP